MSGRPIQSDERHSVPRRAVPCHARAAYKLITTSAGLSVSTYCPLSLPCLAAARPGGTLFSNFLNVEGRLPSTATYCTVSIPLPRDVIGTAKAKLFPAQKCPTLLPPGGEFCLTATPGRQRVTPGLRRCFGPPSPVLWPAAARCAAHPGSCRMSREC